MKVYPVGKNIISRQFKNGEWWYKIKDESIDIGYSWTKYPTFGSYPFYYKMILGILISLFGFAILSIFL